MRSKSSSGKVMQNFTSRVSQWDPLLICFQMMTIQTFFWFLLGGAIWLFSLLHGEPVNLDSLFNPEILSMSSPFFQAPSFFGFLIASAITAFIVFVVVEKSRKCLDFCATAHLWHLIACSLYSEFPTDLSWWFINLFSIGVMTILSTMLCEQKETQEITLTRKT